MSTGGVFHVDDFKGADDREKIQAALDEMSRIGGPKVLRFAKRDYDVRPVRFDSFEPVIGASGISDLRIEGGGAVVVAREALDCQTGYFLKLARFQNVAIRDLVITYRPAPFFQGRILHVDQPRNKTTIALDPVFGNVDSIRQTPYSKLWCRAGIVDRPIWPKPGNPSWMDVGVDGGGRPSAEPDGSGGTTFDMGGINLEHTAGGRHNWQAGDPVVVWKRAGQDALCLEEGRGLVLDNIRVESSLHFAIKLRGVEDATVSRCRVEPAQGAMFSSSADGIDVQQSRNVTIEECVLIATGDDAISVLNHGHGDNGRHFEKKFAPPLPETNEGIVIRNNRIEGANRNGILLLASRAEVCGNALDHIRQYGLKFTGDDTRVENNTFKEIGSFEAYRHIADELDTGVICSDEWVQHRAVIRGNRIEDWHNMPAILVKSVDNALVSENTFVMNHPERIASKPYNPYLDSPAAICVTTGSFRNAATACSDIVIRDNTVSARGGWARVEDAVVVHGSHGGIEIKDNRLLRPE